MFHLRNFGIVELIIVLVLAILLFGPGRIAKLGSELGKSIRGFRKEIKPDESKDTKSEETPSDESEQ